MPLWSSPTLNATRADQVLHTYRKDIIGCAMMPAYNFGWKEVLMSEPMRRPSILAVTLGTGLLLSGCGVGHGWGVATQRDPAGRFPYEITFLTCDNRIFLVLGVDGCSGANMNQKDGTFTAVDGRKVPWACITSNGTTGTVAIAGQQF